MCVHIGGSWAGADVRVRQQQRRGAALPRPGRPRTSASMRRSSRNTKLPREWVGWLGATFSARGSRIAVALVGAMDGDRLDRRGAQSLPLARPGTGRSRSAACCLIVSTPPGAGGGRPAPHGRRTTVLPLRRANAAPPRFPNRSVSLVQRVSQLEDRRVFRNARKGKSRRRCSRH